MARGWNNSPAGSLSWRLTLTVMLAVCGGGRAHSQVPCEYEIAAIILGPECPFTGPAPTRVSAISPNGRWVVGRYSQCDQPRDEAWYYDMTKGELFTIARPEGVYSARAEGVNDAGLVTGEWSRSGKGRRGFLFDAKTGDLTELEPLKGDTHFQPRAIGTDEPRIVGSSSGPTTAAVMWHQGELAQLKLPHGPRSVARSIDSGAKYITGWMGPNTIGDTRGFVWNESGVLEIPWVENSDITIPWATNSFGEATGGVSLPDPQCSGSIGHTFLWAKGELIDIGALPSHDDSAGYGINDSKVIVGLSRESKDCLPILSSAFVWSESTGMIALDDVVVGLSDWQIYEARAINQEGVIATNGRPTSSGLPFPAIVVRPIPRNGDVNCDGIRNVDDLMGVINNWGPCRGCPADLNQDWIVNVDDLLEVINNWG